MIIMHFDVEHAGKWVAMKKQKVVDSGKSLKVLMKKVNKREDKSTIRYSLVPKGCMAGCLYGV